MNVARWLHLLGVTIWVGGMFFAHMALRPSVAALAPRFMRLTAKWYVRGGIYTNVVVEHRKKGWKPGKGYQEGEPNFAVIKEWNAATVYDDAIKLLTPPLPGNWRVYYYDGISHERLKQWDKAEADFAKPGQFFSNYEPLPRSVRACCRLPTRRTDLGRSVHRRRVAVSLA